MVACIAISLVKIILIDARMRSHVIAGIMSTRRQAAAEAERRRGEDAEDVSSAHMAEPASEVGLPAPAPASSHLVMTHLTDCASLTLLLP